MAHGPPQGGGGSFSSIVRETGGSGSPQGDKRKIGGLGVPGELDEGVRGGRGRVFTEDDEIYRNKRCGK